MTKFFENSHPLCRITYLAPKHDEWLFQHGPGIFSAASRTAASPNCNIYCFHIFVINPTWSLLLSFAGLGKCALFNSCCQNYITLLLFDVSMTSLNRRLSKSKELILCINSYWGLLCALEWSYTFAISVTWQVDSPAFYGFEASQSCSPCAHYWAVSWRGIICL